MFCREILANVRDECARIAKEKNVVIVTAAQANIPGRKYTPTISPSSEIQVVTIDYLEMVSPNHNSLL